jgi:hypothetical protein
MHPLVRHLACACERIHSEAVKIFAVIGRVAQKLGENRRVARCTEQSGFPFVYA